MAAAALVVSICALLVSGASLAWQIHIWRSSPAHVIVELGIGDENYEVMAHNRGRLAVTVIAWGLARAPGEEGFLGNPDRISNRLEPADELAWRIPKDDVQEWASQHGVPVGELKPFVLLAGWQRLFGKFSIGE